MHELSSQANPLKISVLGYRLFGASMVLMAKKSYTTYKTMQEIEAYITMCISTTQHVLWMGSFLIITACADIVTIIYHNYIKINRQDSMVSSDSLEPSGIPSTSPTHQFLQLNRCETTAQWEFQADSHRMKLIILLQKWQHKECGQ